MKRVILSFLIFWLCAISAVFGADSSLSRNIISLKIPAQDDFSTIKIPALGLKVGESGIVSREVNGNEFIIAEAQVDFINDGIASVKISDFTKMNEKYLPKPLGKVAQGDKITFRILYDKALLIAPNQSAYQAIVDRFSDMDFLHSDIFATYLAKEGENMPSVADFGRFCAKFDIGLVFIAGQKSLEILNCQSFKILDSSPLNLSNESVIAPFFTRISKESIDNIFSVKKFEPYFAYFEGLIQSKNTRDLGESNAESNVKSNAESNAKSNAKTE